MMRRIFSLPLVSSSSPTWRRLHPIFHASLSLFSSPTLSLRTLATLAALRTSYLTTTSSSSSSPSSPSSSTRFPSPSPSSSPSRTRLGMGMGSSDLEQHVSHARGWVRSYSTLVRHHTLPRRRAHADPLDTIETDGVTSLSSSSSSLSSSSCSSPSYSCSSTGRRDAGSASEEDRLREEGIRGCVSCEPLLVGETKAMIESYVSGLESYYDGKRFTNPFPGWKEMGLWKKIKFVTQAIFTFPRITEEESKRLFPRHVPSSTQLLQPPMDGIQSVWIGHATFLVQIAGKNVLTDPVFSNRASFVQWFGPKRFVPPALAIEDLPPLDVVCVSHNHYDHLDIHSIKQIEAHHHPTFVVPLKLKHWFLQHTSIDKDRILELAWYESADLECGLRSTLVPAQHWSARGLLDRNRTLWGGFVFEDTLPTGTESTPPLRFIHTGDTGYTREFKFIGENYGPFDLALIPIGAYEPRRFLKNQHVNVDEAIQIHLDLQSKFSIGMHWGTFVLTSEPVDEPRRLLLEKTQELNISNFISCAHGETIIVRCPDRGALSVTQSVSSKPSLDYENSSENALSLPSFNMHPSLGSSVPNAFANPPFLQDFRSCDSSTNAQKQIIHSSHS